jgi:hypothetical protein
MRLWLEFLFAISFVGTTGFVFREHFKKNPILTGVVILIAVGSTWLTLEEIGKRLGLIRVDSNLSVEVAQPPTADELFWLAIKDSAVPALFEEFVVKYPASRHVFEAKIKLEGLRTVSVKPSDTSTPAPGEKVHAFTSPPPALSDAQPFDGVRILYFRKDADRGLIENTLRKNLISFETAPAENDEKTNIVTCALDLPFEKAKKLALLLFDAGVELKSIHQHSNPAPKRFTIEALRSLSNAPALTRIDIAQMTECPPRSGPPRLFDLLFDSDKPAVR